MYRILFSILGIFISLIALIYSLGYHGTRTFEEGDNLPPTDLLIKNASALKGTPYDPLMGMYGNIGADLGFIVCSDVPNIAYGLSGYSLKKALALDFAKNPAAYNSKNGNTPKNPYFHRRARNLHAYFKSIGQLMPNSYKPGVGDLVFYKNPQKDYISHVALVSYTSKNEHKVIESAPRTILAQEVDGDSPLERGWILSGYGKVY